MNKNEFRAIIAIVAVAVVSVIAGPIWSWAATTLPAGAIIGWNGTNFVATGTPQLTVGNLLATSSSATNVLMGSTGIGTTSPARTLGVQGSIIASGDLIISNVTASGTATFAGNVGIGTVSPDVGSTGNKVLTVSGAFTRARLQLQNTDDSSVGSVAGTLQFLANTTSLADITSASVGAANSGYLSFSTANSGTVAERMRIAPNGNVGIGSTTPAAALGVQGNILTSGDIITSNITATGTLTIAGAIAGSGTITGTRFIASSNSVASTLPYASSTAQTTSGTQYMGQAAVGTSSPYATLSVEQGTGLGDVFVVGDQGTSTPHLVVKPNGSVGVATTSPNGKFAVGGDVMFGGTFTLVGNMVTSGVITSTSLSASTIPNASSTNVTISNRLYTLLPASLSYSTTTAWAGTTTIPLGPAPFGQEFASVTCFTDAGTLNVAFTDGTNDMNYLNASTTVGNNSLFTNNTFTALEKRYVKVGTPSSSPTSIACTVLWRPN